MTSASKEYHRQWYHKNRARIIGRKKEASDRFRQGRVEWLKAKKAAPCTDCGGVFPHYVMDFDHQRDKLFNIANKVSALSLEELEAEITKCELVCANCHRIRTHGPVGELV